MLFSIRMERFKSQNFVWAIWQSRTGTMMRMETPGAFPKKIGRRRRTSAHLLRFFPWFVSELRMDEVNADRTFRHLSQRK
jgi:hypothetical protein